MCDCTSGCNECNITSLTKGEKGDKGNTGATGPTGAGGIYFESVSSFVSGAIQVNKTYTIVADGDYVIQFEGNFVKDTATSIISKLLKNAVYQSLNANNIHTSTEPTSNAQITYTHTAKLTGLIIGDVIGFGFTCGTGVGTMSNSSITILKLT